MQRSTTAAPDPTGPCTDLADPHRIRGVSPQHASRCWRKGPRSSTLARAHQLNGKPGPIAPRPRSREATKSLGEIARHWIAEPANWRRPKARCSRIYCDLWDRSVRRMLGEEVAPVVEPEPGDNRFKDPEWSQPLLRFLEAVLSDHHALGAKTSTRNTDGLDDKTRTQGRCSI